MFICPSNTLYHDPTVKITEIEREDPILDYIDIVNNMSKSTAKTLIVSSNI